MNLHPAQLEQLANSLTSGIEGEAYFDPYHRGLYSTDASMYQIQPLGVVVPRSVEDVVAAIQISGELGIPLIPRGSGTSLSGQAIGQGLVMDLSKHLNRILEIDPQRGTARVQVGVVLDQLNAAAAGHGLQFGPDVATSSRANLGGMIGNNSAGARSVLYGKTVDHVIELNVVLADGTSAIFGPMNAQQYEQAAEGDDRLAEIYRTVKRVVEENREKIVERFPRVLRRVSGYNLDQFVAECRAWGPIPPGVELVRRRNEAQFPDADFNLSRLIIGAEGTLATVTEALVHLVPLPKARGVLVLEFDSLACAVDALAEVRTHEPSAVELFDQMIVDLAAKSLEYKNYLDFVAGRPESLLLIEFSGNSREEVESILQRVSGQLQNVPGLSHQTWTADPLQCNHIWACRKAALPLLMGIPGNRKPIAFVEDTAVEPRRLPEFVARFRQILERRGTHGAFYGHASVGCLHIRPLIDTRHREELQRMEQILQEVSDLVLEFGGSMSGEHGDGLARSFLNEKLFGSELYQAFQQIKAAFDPQGRMNPGKVVDGPSPVENLRHPPEDAPAEIHTRFDYGGQGGFVAAVELCNGSALCRRNSGGTMCPSYMATRDEEHSTRGRANALRTVLSGRINNERIDSDRLYQTMELCLQCKGCKAECPTNVDVAKLKSEFLNQYYEARGTPLGVRAMGHVWRTNRIGSALAPFSNLLGRTLPAAWLLEKLGHVDRRRPLPRFHRQHFRKWFRRHVPSEQGTRGEIVLLDDCLTNYCEPGVNRAAVQVLEAVGYRVRLAPWRCCGRALISKGMLDEAQRMARENVGQLDLDARQGIPIVGCEPSCVSAVTDDYRDLVPGVATDRVAASTSLIEAHLVKSDVPLAVDPGPREIVLHGHCHQKALVGTADTVQMLSQIPEARVMALDSGCCGMAGSFGYEQYDLSMQIAELVLLPAVRTASPEAAIAAGGFSCRHQIEHGTGRVARHPIEVLAQQWRPSGA